MSPKDMREKVLSELKAGHLGKAMNLLEESELPVDEQLREEAVSACIDSLKRHFHWIIPSFVSAFGIRDDSRLNQLAMKIILLALQHNQPLIADQAARTFGIRLDDAIQGVIESAKAETIRSVGGVTFIQGPSGEYSFTLD
jgi:hypothetical protein